MKKALIGLAFLATLMVLTLGGFWLADYIHDLHEDPVDAYTWLSPGTPGGQAIETYCETHLKCISDFERLFPRSRLMIWPSFPKRRGTQVEVETLVYGRYLVSISQDIRTNRETLSAQAVGGPEFEIWEVTQLDYSPSGGWSQTYGNGQHFGQTEWDRFLSSKGDLSSIMSNIIKDRPLALTEQYLKELEGSN